MPDSIGDVELKERGNAQTGPIRVSHYDVAGNPTAWEEGVFPSANGPNSSNHRLGHLKPANLGTPALDEGILQWNARLPVSTTMLPTLVTT